MKPTDITSHNKACEVLGKDPKVSANIHDQLDDIADAINKVDNEFKADFENTDQPKWRPYFIMDRAGVRFGNSGYGRSHSDATVGSRLCQRFRTEEISDFFGKQFESMHIKSFNS
ncbi:MAG: hypothetical protein JNK73_13075 [Bacteroidia bacterium]|nr:hypothetical protein [Bacteroidia bacterium]